MARTSLISDRSGLRWHSPTGCELPLLFNPPTGGETPDGRSVQSVTYSMHGTSKAINTSYAETERTFFAASAPYLPYLPYLPYYLTEQLSRASNQESSIDNGTVAFSQWGEVVKVTAPMGAIAYSSLPQPVTAT